jgi:hypothetical protein
MPKYAVRETCGGAYSSSDRFDLLTPSNPVGAHGVLAGVGMTRQDCRIYTGPKLRSGPQSRSSRATVRLSSPQAGFAGICGCESGKGNAGRLNHFKVFLPCGMATLLDRSGLTNR